MTIAGIEPEAAWYINNGQETSGPYTLSQLLSIAAEDRDAWWVWNETGQSWEALREFLAAAIDSPNATMSSTTNTDPEVHLDPSTDPASPAIIPGTPGASEAAAIPPRFPCRSHPEYPAVGHCSQCERLLCISCIRVAANLFLCEACTPREAEELPDETQRKIAALLGSWYLDPWKGMGVVLACAIVFFLFFLKPGRGSASDGITSQEATAYWQQAQRSLARAQYLQARNEKERAAKWYETSMHAADQLTKEKTAPSALREQAFVYRMRIALDQEKPDQLGPILAEYGAEIGSATRDRDLSFFKACDAYLNRKNHREAITLFQKLLWGGGFGDDIGVMIDVMSQRSPQAFENAQQLMVEGFSMPELYYRLSVCHQEVGEKLEASQYREYLQQWEAKNPAERVWQDLAVEAGGESPK